MGFTSPDSIVRDAANVLGQKKRAAAGLAAAWCSAGFNSQEVGAGLHIGWPEPGERGMFGHAASPMLTFLGDLLLQCILKRILSCQSLAVLASKIGKGVPKPCCGINTGVINLISSS